VGFCRDSSCVSCLVDDLPDAGGNTTGCTDVALFQRESESSPMLVIEQMSETHFPEGEKLTLTADDATGKRVVDWSATAHYQTHEVDEGPGCDPARCSIFSVEIPSM